MDVVEPDHPNIGAHLQAELGRGVKDTEGDHIAEADDAVDVVVTKELQGQLAGCLLYTSPSPRDRS